MQVDAALLVAMLLGFAVGGAIGYVVGRFIGRVGTVGRLVRSTDPGHWTAAHALVREDARTPIDAPFGYPTPGPMPVVRLDQDDDGEALIPTADRARVHRRKQVDAREATTRRMRRSG